MTLRVKVDGSFVETGGAAAEADEFGWVRPADWLALPEVTISDNKFVGLVAVFDTDSEFVALLCRGNYTVDWGDGTTSNGADNTKVEHEYDYSALPANTLSALGYKQVLITVTPQSGATLTHVVTEIHSARISNTPRIPWLDVTVGQGVVFGCGLQQTYLEHAKFVGAISAVVGGITSSALQSITFDGDLSDMTGIMRDWFSGGMFPPSREWTREVNITAAGLATYGLFQNANIHRIANFDFGPGDQRLALSTKTLAVIENCDFSGSTVSSSTFPTAGSLRKITGCALPKVSFSLSGNAFSRAGLVEVFDQLPDRTGFASPTITIINNPGVVDLTAADRLIATDKNWTIVE